jgi:hypothetical protein
VYDVDPARMQELSALEAELADSPADLAAHCDFISIVVRGEDHLETAAYGPQGLLSGVRPGTVIAIHTNVPPVYSRRLAMRAAGSQVRVLEATMTGGRVARALKYIKDDTFCLTYGDGVSDIDIAASIAFHRKHGRLATVTAVYPPRRFGVLEMEGDRVTGFREKPRGEGGFINGGFFVCEPKFLDYLDDDETDGIDED